MSGESAVNAVAKDWHSSKHIRKRARYLLEHPDAEIPSDVTFLVGDGQNEPQRTFRCHKFILAMVSAMFQAMFYGALAQTEDIVKVPDVTPTAFQNMLRFAYGEDTGLDEICLEGTMDTLYCAKKYLIAKLVRACRDHTQLQIAALKTDPCVVFQRAPQMDEEDLAALALARIAFSTPTVLSGEALPRLSFDCLKLIVDYPHLQATEAVVYEGVRRWVEHNVGIVRGSALRDAFGSLLYSIRFPLLSTSELANGPIADGVLTSDEAVSLFQFLFADTKPALPFLAAPRLPLPAPVGFYFNIVLAPGTTLIGRLVTNTLLLHARTDLSPECSAFLRQLVAHNMHIRIASYDNEHSSKFIPLPAAVPEERNVLSHSVKSACWFEWDMKDGVARNIRIGIGKKPRHYHTAVFGFVFGFNSEYERVPFDLWDDKRILGLADFRFSCIG